MSQLFGHRISSSVYRPPARSLWGHGLTDHPFQSLALTKFLILIEGVICNDINPRFHFHHRNSLWHPQRETIRLFYDQRLHFEPPSLETWGNVLIWIRRKAGKALTLNITPLPLEKMVAVGWASKNICLGQTPNSKCIHILLIWLLKYHSHSICRGSGEDSEELTLLYSLNVRLLDNHSKSCKGLYESLIGYWFKLL